MDKFHQFFTVICLRHDNDGVLLFYAFIRSMVRNLGDPIFIVNMVMFGVF